MTALAIERVETKAQREAFIRVPWQIYRDDPAWIPPLLMERRDLLDRNKNPLFQKAKAALWIASRDGRPVGRISAQRNEAHLARHRDATGQFGLIEGIDDPAVFEGLLGTAEAWLRQEGLARIQGPFSLSINEESGLLVEGFETPPSILMGHARDYYGARIEGAGYAKAMDLIAYRFDTHQAVSPRIQRLLDKGKRTAGLKLRPLDRKRFDEDLRVIMAIFNDAWSQNWNFIPFDEAEIAHMAKSLKPIIEPGHVTIAELHGEPAAMVVTFPNINEAIADLDGRLLPFGWAKLLWRLKVGTPRSARMPLMGVKRAYQGTAIGAIMAYAVIEAAWRFNRDRGVLEGELSWILEENLAIRRVIETVGGQPYKTYRIFEKAL